MKRNTRIIQISGLRGILMVVFIATCLAAGFVAFPSLVAMHVWNYATQYISLPLINFWQGLMLWAIVAISGFILNDRKKYLVAYSPKTNLNDEEVKKILETVKLQSQARALNSMILKSVNEQQKDKKPEKKEEENV